MKKGMLSLCAFGLLTIAAHAQEDYSTWALSRDVTINTTGTGANVAGTVENFPVLVRLTSAQAPVFAAGGATGASIRFTAANGTTRLPHERLRWDSTANLAEFWVRVPSVAGNANNTIKMFVGKADVTDSSNGAAVFNATNGFKAAWHLNETTGGATDATGSGYDATPGTGTPTAATGAPLPGGRTFDGTNQFFYMPTPASGPNSGITSAAYFHFGLKAAYSASVWVSNTYSETNAIMGLISHGNQDWQLQIQNATNCGTGSAAGCYAWSEHSTGVNPAWQNAYEPTPIHDASWHHVFGVRNTTSPYLVLYIDGVKVAEFTTDDGTGKNNNSSTYPLVLGAYPTSTALPPGTSNYFSGSMVAATVAGTNRSDDWVKLSYETQKPGTNAVTVSNGITSVSGARASEFAFSVRNSGAGFLFDLPAGSDARISVLDVRGREVWSRAAGQSPIVAWNGRGMNGERLSAGVYTARVTVREKGSNVTVAQRALSLLP